MDEIPIYQQLPSINLFGHVQPWSACYPSNPNGFQYLNTGPPRSPGAFFGGGIFFHDPSSSSSPAGTPSSDSGYSDLSLFSPGLSNSSVDFEPIPEGSQSCSVATLENLCAPFMSRGGMAGRKKANKSPKKPKKAGNGSVARTQSAAVKKETSDVRQELFLLPIPHRSGGREIRIIRQPEAQHRPRYMTEGSRGRIKDRSGTSCPAVQVVGVGGASGVLQVFIGTDNDPVEAHPSFKVCQVVSRSSCPSAEIVTLADGTTCLEMSFDKINTKIIEVDCVSILKLRNWNIEQQSAVKPWKKSKTNVKSHKSVRLVFRVVVTEDNGPTTALQISSLPICCSNSAGVPEISYLSHKSCSPEGGLVLVVLGRNFLKEGLRLIVREDEEENEDGFVSAVWQEDALLQEDKFNQQHLVGTLPAYRNLQISQPVDVKLVVANKDGKQSTPFSFQYVPDQYTLVNEYPKEKISVDEPFQSPPSPEEPAVISAVSRSPYQHMPVLHPNTLPENSHWHYNLQVPGSNQPIIVSVPQAPYPTHSYSLAQSWHSQNRSQSVIPRLPGDNGIVAQERFASQLNCNILDNLMSSILGSSNSDTPMQE